MSPVGNPLQAAKTFMQALDASDAERAAERLRA